MDKIAESILKFLKLDSLVNHVTGYVEARIELMKVEIREDIAKTVARAIVVISLILIGFLFLLFLSVGLAHFITAYLNSAYLGYWSVAGLYGLIFLILFVFRKSIYATFEHKLMKVIKHKEK
ncbi:MAG: phage holin family protein [Cyclobacteriaceae bacterium]|nr:phage holin family protein [Cyclobacteriaceae bacterium]